MSDENVPPVAKVGIRDATAEGRTLMNTYQRFKAEVSTINEYKSACNKIVDLGVHSLLSAKFKRDKDDVSDDNNVMRQLAPSRHSAPSQAYLLDKH